MSFQSYPKYKDSGVEWLGEVPEGWEVQPIKTVASCNDDVLGESTDEDYELEYVEISDVDVNRGITGSTLYRFQEAPSRARRQVKDGDVIVSTVRTYLRGRFQGPSATRVNEPRLLTSEPFEASRCRPAEASGSHGSYAVGC